MSEMKVEQAIARVRTFAPKDGSPVYVAFSGGKDSVVLKEIVRLSGIPYDAHYNSTTVDPPELIQFIRQFHPDVAFERPAESMYQLIVRKNMVPTRIMRFCCDILKERGGHGRTVLTGVRWAESLRRAKKQTMVRQCIKREAVLINPIIDWTDADVWGLIHELKLPYCSLYDEGFTRLGCIGCPMAGPAGMRREFERWPGFLRLYYRAMEKIVPVLNARRAAQGKPSKFHDARSLMLWWLRDLTKDQRHAQVVSALIDKHCIR